MSRVAIAYKIIRKNMERFNIEDTEENRIRFFIDLRDELVNKSVKTPEIILWIVEMNEEIALRGKNKGYNDTTIHLGDPYVQAQPHPDH